MTASIGMQLVARTIDHSFFFRTFGVIKNIIMESMRFMESL